MLLRRKIALAVCTTAITVPALSSCGFNLATDMDYTPAAGTNNRDGLVKVLSAVVVSAQSDSGTFIAGVSNAHDEAVTVVGLNSERLNAEFEPIEVPAKGFVNLETSEVHVEGVFTAGDVVDVDLELDNGELLPLEVPVVKSCDTFADLDTSPAASEPNDDPVYSCEYPELEGSH